jgi:hypothetical protein
MYIQKKYKVEGVRERVGNKMAKKAGKAHGISISNPNFPHALLIPGSSLILPASSSLLTLLPFK